MSNQLQATGAVKVRNLTGVLVGTSGVVSSLNIDGSLGIPQLDVNGKILVSQLPNSVMEYKGTWDASTNTPTLVNGTGNQGDVYLCNVAGTVNFGAGAIAFFVGDQVIYSGSIWQRASGATGTVTSVAVTETGDSLNITGSPITTSGTINIGFNGTNLQYINGAGDLTTFPSLTGYVPYTGATANVDLGVYDLTADLITGARGSFASNGGSDTFAINHSSGAGIALNITKGGSGEGLYINKTSGSGNAATIIGTLEATTLVKSGGTSSQYLMADGSTSTLTNPVTGTGSDGRVAFWTGASTLSSDANLYYDYSTDRLGIGTNTPNASLGILNSSSTGIQVRTSDSANQYQANIFYDASYGMVYGYNRLGTGTASNLTFFNNIGGFISIPESATNNIGFNTLNPQGLAGASVYDFTSLNTNVELRLHNSSTGYTSTDGSFVRVTSTALVIANAESSQSIFINNGGLEVITINGTNKVAIGSVGVVPMTQQLTVIGSIEAYGGSIYQTVTSSMLKANASGQIIAAIAGTDYLAVGSAVTSVTATSPILSSGGTTPNISIPAATTSVSGYLTSTDWTTFNNKGTFSLPSLTSGSVLFSNGSTIAQDNANFFWDDVNNRLGIGTSSPTEILHILGASAIVYIDGNSAGTQTSATLRLRTGGFNVGNFRYNVATDNIEISNVSAGGAVTSGAVKIYGTSGSTTGLTIAAAGGGTFASTLTVGTTAFVTNDIFIGDTTSGSGRFFITDSSNQGITLRRTGATGDRFKMFVGNGTTYTQDNCIILGTNTDIDFYTGSSPLRRMTIGNGGNVGIGTNAGSGLLHIVKDGAGNSNTSITGSQLVLSRTTGFGENLAFRNTGSSAGISGTTYAGQIISAGNNIMEIYTDVANPIILGTNATERMRITSGGDVSIGGVTPSERLDINHSSSTACFIRLRSTAGSGVYVGNRDNNLELWSGGTKNMTITSGGNLGIGLAGSSNVRLQMKSGGSTSGSYATIINNSASTDLFYLRDDGIFFTGVATFSPYNYSTSGRSAVIESSGILGYLVSTRESKSNIKSITNVDFISQLNPVQFNYRKKDNLTNEYTDELYDNVTYGFIADEVEKVNKELVFYNEDGVTLAGVEYNSMIAILIKAVQELKAEIEILKNK